MFAGLRVIDCASYVAAPAAATVLSDFGAEVVKIEPPGEGEPWHVHYQRPGMPASEHNHPWLMDNRNKSGLALDLKSEAGRAVLERLVSQADVFITNTPLPARERLRMRYADFAEKYPRLIYASLTAYGEAGEEAGKTGFDATAYWARSGLMDEVRPDHRAIPARSVAGMGDRPTAMALYGAIVTALYRREKTGRGGEVRASLMASGMWANAYLIQAKLCGVDFPPRPAARGVGQRPGQHLPHRRRPLVHARHRQRAAMAGAGAWRWECRNCQPIPASRTPRRGGSTPSC